MAWDGRGWGWKWNGLGERNEDTLCTNQPTNQSIKQAIKQPANQPINHYIATSDRTFRRQPKKLVRV